MRSVKVGGMVAMVAATVAGAAAGETGQAARMLKSGTTIVLGHRDASLPFSFLDGQRKPAGYTMDLCGHIVDAIKKSLAPADLKLSYVQLSSSDRIEKVRDGTVDLECGSTSITAQRSGEVAFSRPIFYADTKILVRTDSGIQSIADLRDKRVIVNQGAAGAPLLARADMENSLHIQFVKSHDNLESFKALQAGKVDAFVHDDVQLAMLAATSGSPRSYTLLNASLSSDPIAIMMRKDNKPLQQLVDQTLARLSASGEFAKVYARWFLTPTFKFPMSERLRRELQNQAVLAPAPGN